MKWFFGGIIVFFVIFIIAITSSAKVAQLMWDKVNELETQYPSEEFEEEKYEDPDQFEFDHQERLIERRKIAAFAQTMTEFSLAKDMYAQIIKMYEETNLQYTDDYERSQKELLYMMEKTSRVVDSLKYAATLINDYPDHPYMESILASKKRLTIRRLNQ